jgi:hypothetical protein
MPVRVVVLFVFCVWAAMSVLSRAVSAQTAPVADGRATGRRPLPAGPGDDVIGIRAELLAWSALDDVQLDRLLKSQH